MGMSYIYGRLGDLRGLSTYVWDFMGCISGQSSSLDGDYDSIKDAKAFEPRHRLMKLGLVTHTQQARKQRKEKKNRAKKVRGTKKSKPVAPKAAK